MATDLEKFLAKLSTKERLVALDLIKRVKMQALIGMNIKSLKGSDGYYRARKGRLRLIYFFDGDTAIIKSLSYRDDQTYKDF